MQEEREEERENVICLRKCDDLRVCLHVSTFEKQKDQSDSLNDEYRRIFFAGGNASVYFSVHTFVLFFHLLQELFSTLSLSFLSQSSLTLSSFSTHSLHPLLKLEMSRSWAAV